MFQRTSRRIYTQQLMDLYSASESITFPLVLEEYQRKSIELSYYL